MTKKILQIEPWIGKEEEREVLEVLRSGWITEANKTKEFESMLSEFVGAKYVSVVPNGTVSLFIGLMALGVKAADEVIVPDFTMVASANVVVLCGAKPVFVDISRKTLCMNEDDIESKITPRTKAIMPVAFNGRSPDMNKIKRVASKYHLFIIEDAAQALGSYFHGTHLGTLGDIGSFSFSTPKVITTCQGGALITNNKSLFEKILRVKDFGRLDRNTQDHNTLGYNFKFTDVLAAIGIAQMKKLSWRIKRKKQMYKKYYDLLHDIKQIQFLATNLKEVSPWFVDILVPSPVKLQNFLKEKGIGTRLFYPSIHTLKLYKKKNVLFSNSLWASQHGLWLPSSSFLTDSDIIRICSSIREFYKRSL